MGKSLGLRAPLVAVAGSLAQVGGHMRVTFSGLSHVFVSAPGVGSLKKSLQNGMNSYLQPPGAPTPSPALTQPPPAHYLIQLNP